MTSFKASDKNLPLWLLAELTYSCPLQCAYCSNPLNYNESRKNELSTDEWLRVIREARELGALQIGFSGGEPLVRRDLETLITEAKQLGFYTNLITSSVGMDIDRYNRILEAGLDHLQISFQGAEKEVNDYYAANHSFEHKVEMAKAVKASGLPMVLNFVLHQGNIHQVTDILEFSRSLGADYVELANCQYYGWALENRESLMPSYEQLKQAENATAAFRERHPDAMKIYFVVPDYYEGRPKPCCNGWGTTFLTVTPNGTAMPCQGANVLPGLHFPSVREHSIEWIWQDSELFNRFRGLDWMQEPCKSCPEKEQDLGGCRCQAYMITGDFEATDPVCDLSPKHDEILKVIDQQSAEVVDSKPRNLIFRNPKNYNDIIAKSR